MIQKMTIPVILISIISDYSRLLLDGVELRASDQSRESSAELRTRIKAWRSLKLTVQDTGFHVIKAYTEDRR